MFWLAFKAEDEYLYTLDTFGINLTFFSCQASEHCNKLVKQSLRDGKDEMLNKVGYLMAQQMQNKVICGSGVANKK